MTIDDPLSHDPMSETARKVNEIIPGSVGGPIESVKTAVILALREAVTGTTLNHLVNGDKIKIDQEYPMVPEKYPGIWVQFSFTKLQNAGLAQEALVRSVENENTPQEYVNWEPVREFMFEGRVTLSIVALTSLERDRISDAVLTMLMFSRPPQTWITHADRDTKQFRQFLGSLSANPYISMTYNQDLIVPGGQSVTPGVPWDPEQLGYEDSWSFDLLGYTNIIFKNDGTYSLRAVQWDPFLEGTAPPVPDGDGWF